MILRPVTFLMIAMAACQLHAQQVQWLTSEPITFTVNPAFPRHMVSVSDNGILGASRLVTSNMVFGQDVFGDYSVERLDPQTGQLIWGCLLGDSVAVKSIAVDTSGNIYVAGGFMGDLLPCTGPSVANTGVGWQVDLFLMKFDANGTIQWMRNITVAHPWATEIPVLAVDPAGELWYSLCDFFTGELVRVDALANDVESRTITGAKTIGGVDFDPWGRMFVSGAASVSGLSFGGQNFPNPEQYSMFVLRYAAAGLASWVEFAHDETFQAPSLACDPFGSAFVAGGLIDSTAFGSIAFNGPDWGSATFVTKVDSTGQFLWGVESDPAGGAITGDLERSAGTCIAADDSGRVFLIGTVRGLVDWGSGVVSDGLTLGISSLTVVRFGSDGTPHWAVTSQPGGGSLNTQNIAVEPSGVAYFATHVSGPFTLTPFTVNSGGQQASVFGRIDDALVTGLPHAVPEDLLDAWPVPSTGPITVRHGGREPVQAELLDATGQRLRGLLLKPGINVLDMDAEASGMYFLRTAEGAVVRLTVR